MTDTTITDAVVFPQDKGSGVADGNESFNSAGYLSLLAKYKGDGSYVGEDDAGTATLQFNQVDTTNEQVDVSPGYAYIMESGHTVQSGSQQTYDTTLPNSTPYVVILPTEVGNLGLGTDTGNDLWLAVDPTANETVYLRHGSGLTAPTDPNVKLGTVDSSTGGTTRANDLATATIGDISGTSLQYDSVSTESLVIGGTLYEEDDNSPISVSNQSSVSYNVAGDYDTIIILPDFSTTGYDELQVNGDTGSNYDIVALDGSTTSGSTQWSIPRANTRPSIQIFDAGSRLRISLPACTGAPTQTVAGENSNVGGNGITSITLSDDGGSGRDLTARVYGRKI